MGHWSCYQYCLSEGRIAVGNKLASLGFVGAGRMATALSRGAVSSGLVAPENIRASDPNADALRAFSDAVPGATVTDRNEDVLEACGVVVLAVKPQVILGVAAAIAPHVAQRHLLVSIAAGTSLAAISSALPRGTRMARVMPNTPCLVGMGAACYCMGPTASEEDAQAVEDLLGAVGQGFRVEEEQIDAVTGVSGSGPAFIYSVVEALANAGAEAGLDPVLSLQLATLTTRGAAEMLLATGESPEALRRQVMSPGGTTVAGLEALEKAGGNADLRAAVLAAVARSKELGK